MFGSLMIHHVTFGSAVRFSLCHFSIMEIKLSGKWDVDFADVG